MAAAGRGVGVGGGRVGVAVAPGAGLAVAVHPASISAARRMRRAVLCIVMGMIIPEFTRLPPARRGTPRVIAGGSTYRVAGVWDRVGLVSPDGIRTRDPGIDRDGERVSMLYLIHLT